MNLKQFKYQKAKLKKKKNIFATRSYKWKSNKQPKALQE